MNGTEASEKKASEKKGAEKAGARVDKGSIVEEGTRWK